MLPGRLLGLTWIFGSPESLEAWSAESACCTAGGWIVFASPHVLNVCRPWTSLWVTETVVGVIWVGEKKFWMFCASGVKLREAARPTATRLAAAGLRQPQPPSDGALPRLASRSTTGWRRGAPAGPGTLKRPSAA